ncbi:MAG: bacteriophage abortive infection AbiH family protein [Desulfurivibrionaceae bacterium]|jgi:hypothetical protein
MSTLHIVGNGFDLWHGLLTSYDRFYEFAKDTLDELESFYCIDTTPDGPWTDFENSLGRFDWRLFYDAHDHTDIAADNFRPSEAFCLEDDLTEQADAHVDAIKERFHAWIDAIDVSLASKKMSFAETDLFLTFNYTSTLQLVYGIDNGNIVHIHGRSDAYDELVFGHGATMREEPELDENGDSNRTMFSDAEGAAKYPFYALQKPVSEIVAKNSNFFHSLGSVSTIRVIGHSLNDIDLPYFDEVAKNAKGAKWVVCCRRPEDEDYYTQQLLKCGVHRGDITVCAYADL